MPTSNNPQNNAGHHVALLLALFVLVIVIALPLASTNVAALVKQSDSGSISSANAQENPLSLNRWSSNGPYGGQVFSLAIDPSNPAVIYAAAGGGVFKSTNGGGSWSQSLRPDYNHSTYTLAIDPAAPTTLYAGGNYGAFKSIDSGASWREINNGLANENGNALVYSLVIDCQNSTTLYASWAGNDGIFKTTDGGISWHRLNPFFNQNPFVINLAIDPVHSNIVYASSLYRIIKSTDGGANWNVILNGSATVYFALFGLAIDPINTDTIYASNSDHGRGILFKSTNGGVTWTQFNLSGSGFNSPLAIDRTNPNIIYAGGINSLSKSTNGGQSWIEVNNGLANSESVGALAIDPVNPSLVYAGTGGGVFKSVNGGVSWNAVNNGLRGGVNVSALAINPGNANVIYTQNYPQFFKSANNGGSWTPSDFYPLAFDPRDQNTIYSTSVTGRFGLSKSRDSGATWANIGLPLSLSGSRYIAALAIDPNNSAVIYVALGGTNGGVFKSIDGGASWNESSAVPDGISTLAIDPRNSNIIYAGGNSLFKSSDGGGSWNAIGNLTAPGLLVIDPGNSQTLYAVAYDFNSDTGAAYKSTDGGGDWNAIFLEVSSLVIDPVHPNVIYVGTYSNGVFRSADGGASWNPFNDGLTILYIYALAIDASGNFLHAGTPAGVFDIQLQANQIDDSQFFVRQHYRDFLNREPDASGLAYWTDRITQCGSDVRCIHERRIGVSAAFFIELEFQDTGYFVYRFYKASFGRQPNYTEFTSDRNKVIGGSNLEAKKQAFADEWVQRPAFVSAYPITMSNTEVVNKLFDSAGLTASIYDSQRQQEIQALNAGRSRALVLRDVNEIPDFKNIPDPSSPRYSELKQVSQYNPAFVLMQYFGYLKRNVDQRGYDFWLDVLNNRDSNNYRGMVCSFITSTEYQLRFGSVVTRSNADCGQ